MKLKLFKKLKRAKNTKKRHQKEWWCFWGIEG